MAAGVTDIASDSPEIDDLLALVRDIAESELAPLAADAEERGEFPRDSLRVLGRAGLINLYALLQNTLLVFREKGQIRWEAFRILGPSLAVGVILGFVMVRFIPDSVMPILVALSALASLVTLMAWRAGPSPASGITAGVWSGAINTYAGVGGPPVASYLISQGWAHADFLRTLQVVFIGIDLVSLPILGEVKVAGLTTEQVRLAIEGALRERKVLQTPRVSVEVKDFRSRRVAVVGAVRDPGVYSLRQNVSTLIEVLSLAGGLSERSGQVIYVIRSPAPTLVAGVAPGLDKQGETVAPERQVITIDLFDLMETGDMQLNVVVQPGDVVNVPEAMKFFVVGFINEPGGFPLNRPTTILEAVALCKGVREREASPSYCMLKRRTAEQELLIPVDLVAIARGEHPNMYLSANDILDVRQTTAKRWWLDTMDVVKSVFSISIGYSLNSK